MPLYQLGVTFSNCRVLARVDAVNRYKDANLCSGSQYQPIVIYQPRLIAIPQVMHHERPGIQVTAT
jgi:hypothetical protein